MAGIVCPVCQHRNPRGYRSCDNCGANLQQAPLIIPNQSNLTISKPQLPSRELKALGASVAVSVFALLAEAGLIWLRRRVQQMELVSTPGKKQRNLPAVVENSPMPKKNKQVTTVLSERIIEEKRWGRKTRRIIERFAWRHEIEE